jgi:kynureninase
MQHETSIEYAAQLDKNDTLQYLRNEFYIPLVHGKPSIYFLGNSLGLQPKTTQNEVLNIMENWANFGVEGFFMGNNPWLQYHKKILPQMAVIAGAEEEELVIMNHLTVNLHLLLVSFYRPTKTRYKIICEAKAFPSDQYMLQSQIKLHGLNVKDCIIEVQPTAENETISNDDIIAAIKQHGEAVALVFLGGVNYYTGQLFNIASITNAAHSVGAYAGYDLAHAAGNVELQLHHWGVDFASWCNYKYLNSGPGAIATAFIHKKHLAKNNFVRLEGWWGNNINNRFKMEPQFTPSTTAESWQMSTAPVMQLAAVKASMEMFTKAGFNNLLKKNDQLSSYLFFMLNSINTQNKFTILTPQQNNAHGCQVSILIHQNAKQVFDALLPKGIFADWREPNVIRVAPVALYNTFTDIYVFTQTLKKLLYV